MALPTWPAGSSPNYFTDVGFILRCNQACAPCVPASAWQQRPLRCGQLPVSNPPEPRALGAGSPGLVRVMPEPQEPGSSRGVRQSCGRKEEGDTIEEPDGGSWGWVGGGKRRRMGSRLRGGSCARMTGSRPVRPWCRRQRGPLWGGRDSGPADPAARPALRTSTHARREASAAQPWAPRAPRPLPRPGQLAGGPTATVCLMQRYSWKRPVRASICQPPVRRGGHLPGPEMSVLFYWGFLGAAPFLFWGIRVSGWGELLSEVSVTFCPRPASQGLWPRSPLTSLSFPLFLGTEV